MSIKYIQAALAPLLTIALIVLCGSCGNTGRNQAGGIDTTADKDGFIQIFDGKSFTGWDGDTAFWRVDSGRFIGEETPQKQLKANSFLIWRGATPGNFEFKAEYRISPDGNSGINYRSEELKDIRWAVKGYQADIDGANQYTGQNYEERGRGFLAMRGQKVTIATSAKPVVVDSLGNMDSLKKYIKLNDWNEVWVVAKSNNMKHYINGVLMSEATDNDTANRKFDGIIGLQLHVKPYMKVEFKNIRYKKISGN